jgi:hypothetical protein
MATSTLRQVLNVFEEASGPLSLSNVAHQLDVSQGHLESMIQYWVRKGRIRETAAGKECGSCGLNGECPFVMEMPRSYELAPAGEVIPLTAVGTSCCGGSTASSCGCGCSH